MDCFINYIGIEGCANPTADSGRYINRLLPGITLESIVKIAEADQVTYLGVWDDIQARAALRFENDISREFQKRYQIKNLTQSFDLMKFIDTTDNQTGAAAKWRGFTIEMQAENIYHWAGSALQCINMQSVRLYRKEVTAAVTGKIFNLETGEVLATFTVPVNTAAGWTDVNINRRLFAQRIFIAFDSTAVNCVELSIQNDLVNRFTGCACDWFGNCDARIRSAESEDLSPNITDAAITFGSNIFGLSGVFSIGCTYYSIACQNKSSFLLPWAYLLGSELMWTRRNTSQINRWTIGIDAKKAGELMDDFETRYAKELTTVIDGINLNDGDCCLECNGQVRYQEAGL